MNTYKTIIVIAGLLLVLTAQSLYSQQMVHSDTTSIDGHMFIIQISSDSSLGQIAGGSIYDKWFRIYRNSELVFNKVITSKNCDEVALPPSKAFVVFYRALPVMENSEILPASVTFYGLNGEILKDVKVEGGILGIDVADDKSFVLFGPSASHRLVGIEKYYMSFYDSTGNPIKTHPKVFNNPDGVSDGDSRSLLWANKYYFVVNNPSFPVIAKSKSCLYCYDDNTGDLLWKNILPFVRGIPLMMDNDMFHPIIADTGDQTISIHCTRGAKNYTLKYNMSGKLLDKKEVR